MDKSWIKELKLHVGGGKSVISEYVNAQSNLLETGLITESMNSPLNENYFLTSTFQ